MHYRRALDLWAQVDDAAAIAGVDRLWLLEQAAEVASLAGSHHAAVQLADQLLLELDAGREAERHARILSRRALYSWHAGDRSTSPAATEVLRGGVDSGVTLAAVTRLCGVAYQSALELRYLEALALANDALAAAREIGGPAELGHALHVTGSLRGSSRTVRRRHRSACTARSSWRRRSATRNASGRPGTTWSRPTSSPDGPKRRRRWRARASLTSRTWAYVARTRRSRRVSTPWRWWRSVGGPRPTPSARRCSAATSTRTSPCPSTSPGCSSWCAAATTRTRTACLGDLADSFAGNAYATAVCAAWEAELALWRREWSRARAAVDRARTTIAATDEVMLELRLAGVASACRGGPLRLDPCRRRDGRPWCRRRADRARGAWCRGPAHPRRGGRRRPIGAVPPVARLRPRRGGSTVGAAVGGSVDGPAGRRRRRSVLRGLRRDGGPPRRCSPSTSAARRTPPRVSCGRRRRRRVRWAPHRSAPRSLVWRAAPGS